MQTSLSETFLGTTAGIEAERILRACVHCGFCTATCPTYQLRGDELDGPRGRIYLIKQMLEGETVTRRTQQHLDRCLTCRSCETTCPSGVQYARLLDIGRELVEQKVQRPWVERLQRGVLRRLLPHPRRFAFLLRQGQLFKPLLPSSIKAKIPEKQAASPRPKPRHRRRMLMLEGCVQSVATPNTNAAAARVLDRLGISLVASPGQGCCGAVSQHLSARGEAQDFMRGNIDAWWPHIEAGAEAIVVTASGCGAHVKDYGHLLQEDPGYAEKAVRVAEMALDLAEVIAGEDIEALGITRDQRVAFHPPCTLQHGQQLTGIVEEILRRLGFKITPVADSHLCCGSAGTYSILQPDLSMQLRENKLKSLQAGKPDLIATANVGCQLHLEGGAGVAVKHWIELIDDALA